MVIRITSVTPIDGTASTAVCPAPADLDDLSEFRDDLLKTA
jgi:hypothetical protein